MILAMFLPRNNLEKVWFFEKIFLLTNISMKIVLEMLFFSLSNTNFKFSELKKSIWRFNNTIKILSTICQIKLISKRKFTKAAINENFKTFMMHMSIPKAEISIYQMQAAQISALYWVKVHTKIPFKYANFSNSFSFNLAIKSLENISINKYVIKFVKEKQSFYKLSYTLNLVKVKTLKTYIETYLKTRLIYNSKSSSDVSIYINKKLSDNFCLYVNYRDIKILTMKYWYLFPLIDILLDWLSRAKRFT